MHLTENCHDLRQDLNLTPFSLVRDALIEEIEASLLTKYLD